MKNESRAEGRERMKNESGAEETGSAGSAKVAGGTKAKAVVKGGGVIRAIQKSA